MVESMPYVKLLEPLEISIGNPAHSWGKWKQKFEICLKATGASKKLNEMKVGPLLITSVSHVWKFTQTSFTYPNVKIPREEKINSQPKILTTK